MLSYIRIFPTHHINIFPSDAVCPASSELKSWKLFYVLENTDRAEKHSLLTFFLLLHSRTIYNSMEFIINVLFFQNETLGER